MSSNGKNCNMKAVILAAGMGSRIRPHTNNCPKALLQIAGSTLLTRMISHIQDCGITEVVFVVGYLQESIKAHVKDQFPGLDAHFVTNEQYAETNTGFSLMLAKDWIGGSAFIKFDADVVFEKEILTSLIECEYENCLCIDKQIDLAAEEIKVIVDDQGWVVKANKTVDPKVAIGESIGIEKISGKAVAVLFTELEAMMKHKDNYQEYCERAYERMIENSVPFYALDISGLKWTEIDTHEDFIAAENIFG